MAMTPGEKKTLLMRFGLDEKSAEYYLQMETDIWAVLPTFRLLKPLDEHLEFYRGEYKKLIEKHAMDGTLNEKMPLEAKMLQAGISPEDIEAFAFDLTLTAYENLLYQLDDHEGAEVDEVFMTEPIEKCGYARLMEMGTDGKPTGRFLIGTHGKLPFSN